MEAPISNLMVRRKALPFALIFIILCAGLISTASNNKAEKLINTKTCFVAAKGVFESLALRPSCVSKEVKASKQNLSLVVLGITS